MQHQWLKDVVKNHRDALITFLKQQVSKHGPIKEDNALNNYNPLCRVADAPSPLCDSVGASIHVYDKERNQWPAMLEKIPNHKRRNSDVVLSSYWYYNVHFPACNDQKGLFLNNYELPVHYHPWFEFIKIHITAKNKPYTKISWAGKYILTCGSTGEICYCDLETVEWKTFPFRINTYFPDIFAVIPVEDEFYILSNGSHAALNLNTCKVRKLPAPGGTDAWTYFDAIRAREFIICTDAQDAYLFNLITESWCKPPISNPPSTKLLFHSFLFDDYNTIYGIACSKSAFGVSTSVKSWLLLSLNLDERPWTWTLVGDLLGRGPTSLFIHENEQGRDRFIDKKIEQGLAKCKYPEKKNWATMFSLAQISKSTQEVMEMFDNLPISEKVQYFKKEKIAILEAFDNCLRHAEQQIKAMAFELAKHDFDLAHEIPEKLRNYKIVALQDGTPYICPPTVDPRFYSSCLLKTETNSDDYPTFYTPYAAPTAPPLSSQSAEISSSSSKNADISPSSSKNAEISSSSSKSDLLSSESSSSSHPNTTATLTSTSKQEKRNHILKQLYDKEISVPELFQCPITRNIMFEPVFTADGNTYEKEAILEWFSKGNQTSPLTNLVLENTKIAPNIALKQEVFSST